MFEITIKEISTSTQLVKEYQRIGTEEVDREGRFWNGSPDEPKTRIEDKYGYVEVEKPVNVECEMLKQTVKELDFPSVIKAINFPDAWKPVRME